MAILRSVDARYFAVPDEVLEQYQVPEERVRQLRDTGDLEPAVAVAVATVEEPAREDDSSGATFAHWRNRWRNWHNYWRNYH